MIFLSILENPIIEFLRNIQGKDFLVYYAILTVIVIITVKLILVNMEKKEDNENVRVETNPLTIMLLGNHSNIEYKIVEQQIFKLWKKGYIDIEQEKYGPTFRQVVNSDIKRFSEFDIAIWNKIAEPQTIRSIRDDETVKLEIKKIIEEGNAKIDKEILYKNPKFYRLQRIIRESVFVLLISIGFTKFMLGLTYQKPVLFLIILLVLAVILYYGINYISELKKSTQKELKKIEEKYYNHQKNENISEDDYTMMLCLFGTSSLSAHPETVVFGAAIAASYATSSASSTGCSGCSGGGASCGGGGCGGGGCGGGCGGCGGS